MDEQIRQLAERLRGLREILGLTQEEIATSCDIPLDRYEKAESGEWDISVGMLQKLSKKYNIDLDILMFGEEPKVCSYFLSRAGKGVSIERVEEYKYVSLASGFKGRVSDPFIVIVEPRSDEKIVVNSHTGQEFNYVLSGKLKLSLNGKEIILNEGDSIYFDSKQPHGVLALDGKTARFLAIIM